MFRSTLIAAGAVALCGVGFAQQRLDPAKIHPVTGPIRDAGVFDWQTKQWVSGPKANQLLASQYTVYRNDCTWQTQAYYFGTPECWDMVDEGELPATDTPLSSYPGVGPNGVHIQSGVAISGYTDDQIISSAQFAYCTFTLAGSVDIKVGFYDNLRGNCANGQAVKGKPFNLTLPAQAIPFGTQTAYFDFGAPGFPLPGSSVVGNQSCWIVTITFPNNAGFCMQSEGDGSWDNDDDLDKFSWSFEHNNVPFSATEDDGLLITGEPNSEGFGAGSYNIPAGTDLFFGPANGFPITPCGTGFGQFDGWWMNLDGSSQGAGTGGNCPQNPALPFTVTTGCYWFGGWPGNPLGSFWMVMGSTGSCGGCSNRPSTYCTSGTTSSGCQALISATGTSSATAATGFFVKATNVEGNKSGLFFYGTNGPKVGGATSWGATSSFQCIEPPVKRDATQAGVGTNGACDGSFSSDLNARWTAKPNHNPGAGAQVDGQYWFRDPAGPNPDTALSNAISWTVCP
jgi:hypothetical protein